jgi:tRNA threonylcarbamoyladenosine biosynthesis protein TsaE
MNILSESDKNTQALGQTLAGFLKTGDVVCLIGDLGSGKTALVSGMAQALGLKDSISSPTFTLVNEYDTDPKLLHFDVYRINDPEEILMIGWEEYLDNQGIVVVEWADLIQEILPPAYLEIHVTKGEQTNLRIFHLKGIGERYEAILEELENLSLKKEGSH